MNIDIFYEKLISFFVEVNVWIYINFDFALCVLLSLAYVKSMV